MNKMFRDCEFWIVFRVGHTSLPTCLEPLRKIHVSHSRSPSETPGQEPPPLCKKVLNSEKTVQ